MIQQHDTRDTAVTGRMRLYNESPCAYLWALRLSCQLCLVHKLSLRGGLKASLQHQQSF